MRLLFAVMIAALLAPGVARAGLHTQITTYPGAGGPVSVGDFDGDGHVDVLSVGGRISILLHGQGAGAFAPEFSSQFELISAMTIGDFDGDGRADRASWNRNGTTVGAQRFPGIFSPVTGDIDGNGHLDLVGVTNTGIAVLLGDGHGTFAAPVPHELGASGLPAIADVNGDHRDDVVVIAQNRQTVLLSAGDGTLTETWSSPVSCCPKTMAAGDLNGDGLEDVVTSGSFASDVQLFAGRPDGTLAAPVAVPFGFSPYITVGDANADHRPDLIGITAYGVLTAALGNGDGTFGAPFGEPIQGHYQTPTATDVSGDGYDDIILGELDAPSVTVAINAPNATTSADTLDFGTLAPGAAGKPQTLTVRNDALPPLVVAPATVTGTDFVLSTDGCSAHVLTADQTCSVTVTATPTATGTRAADLLIAGQKVALHANAVAPNRVTVKVAKQRLRTVLAYGLKVRLSCTAACSLSARLTGRSAAKRLSLAKAGARTLTLKLTPRARRALRGHRSAKLTLRVVPTGAKAITKTITL